MRILRLWKSLSFLQSYKCIRNTVDVGVIMVWDEEGGRRYRSNSPEKRELMFLFLNQRIWKKYKISNRETILKSGIFDSRKLTGHISITSYEI